MKSKQIGRILGAVLILVLVAAPGGAQTFLQQVFPDNTVFFEIPVTSSGQVSITTMWNRITADLLEVMVCQGVGDPIDWGASFADQDRTLRMDVGVFSGLNCVVGVSTDNTAAFAINFQEFHDGGLIPAMLATTPRPIDRKSLEPALLAQVEAAIDRARTLRQKYLSARPTP